VGGTAGGPWQGGALPVATTPLFGRDAELALLDDALTGSDARLITLTGPPGVGKTRLALAAAAAARFRDGIVFVDLTTVRDPDLVPQEVTRALGLDDAPVRPLVDRVAAAVAGRHLLLVVDNAEHVLDAAAAITAPLAACPRLRLLVTSRERLRVQGEREFPVSPLTLPAPDDLADLERLAATPSIAMLLHRVRGFQPDFAVTRANAAAVAEICTRLDGLPLALELAAARLNLFTPGELTFRLRQRMRLLTSGARDGPPRHRTLRAALAWSHDLLGPEERALFRRSSVFVGGWSLDAAQQVGDVPDVVDTAASLVDKSLVRHRDRHGASEFTMLESLREYAAELLAEHGEEDATRNRHCRYYAAVAARIEARIGTDAETASVDAVAADQANLRAAFEYAAASGRADLALPLAGAVGWFCYTRGHLGAGLRTVRRALAMVGDDPVHPPGTAMASALQLAGVLSFARGELDVVEAFLDHVERIGDRRHAAMSSAFRGHLARVRGDPTAAAAHHDRARALYEELGNAHGVAWSRYDLGLLRRRDDPEEAAEHLREALTRFRDSGYAWAIGCAGWALATVELRRGRVDEAAALVAEALDRFETVADGRGLAQCLEAAAGIACERTAHGPAGRLLGAAAALRERLAAPLPDEDRGQHHAVTQRVRRALGPDGADATRRAGRELSTVEALALARHIGWPTGEHAEADAAGPAEPVTPLTPRERQVAGLIAAGRTNRQIGRTLGIAEKTTEVHVHHIIGKLGARCRSEVAAWVGAQGRSG
jgi:predicted ATPase/DNA-binding CsgD family transcriptional regulator